LALARQIDNDASRDQFQAEIALAQSTSGARSAALETVWRIRDDGIRYDVLRRIRARPVGAAGGGPQADFDSLIDLMTSTIAPTTWEANGGAGAVSEFASGVYVDPTGVLQRIETSGNTQLEELWQRSASVRGNSDIRRFSPVRKISVRRLEKHLQQRWAMGQGPTDAMQVLAGLQRLQHVFVYPEHGDIVVAGPAGDWRRDAEGRQVSVDHGRPLVQLDDLVVVLRNAYQGNGRFGCSITPTRKNLERTRQFLAESSGRPLKPHQRNQWLERLRGRLGLQQISVYGVDPRSRVARVLVEADYRMKLVGMGLEEGTLGVTSYLDSIEVPYGEAPPAMDVLRWWFTLNYRTIQATQARNAFSLQGQGVQVMSENELLTERGERVATGVSDERNQQFADAFTSHFPTLAARYPIYAELQNIFDLALAAAVLRAEDLPARMGWQMTHLLDPAGYRPSLGTAPRQVPTVMNHRVIHRKYILAGVSGGVTVDPQRWLRRKAIQAVSYGELNNAWDQGRPTAEPDRRHWWWD
jgi:hypothetical protein